MMIFSELLQKNYDKLLHITCTFALMAFGVRTNLLSTGLVVTIVLSLQAAKTIWNYTKATTYKPYGDWVANMGGYALYVAYWLLGR